MITKLPAAEQKPETAIREAAAEQKPEMAAREAAAEQKPEMDSREQIPEAIPEIPLKPQKNIAGAPGRPYIKLPLLHPKYRNIPDSSAARQK